MICNKTIENYIEQKKKQTQKNIRIWITWLRDLILINDCERKLWYKSRGYKERDSDYPLFPKVVHNSLLLSAVDMILEEKQQVEPRVERFEIDITEKLEAFGHLTNGVRVIVAGETDCSFFIEDKKKLIILNLETKSNSKVNDKQLVQLMLYNYFVGLKYPERKVSGLVVIADKTGNFPIIKKVKFDLKQYEPWLMKYISRFLSENAPIPLRIKMYRKDMCNWCGLSECSLRLP